MLSLRAGKYHRMSGNKGSIRFCFAYIALYGASMPKINELVVICALIILPVVLFFFFWIRGDLRESRKQKMEILRLWKKGIPLHTIPGSRIMPEKIKERFRPPPPKFLICFFAIGLAPIAFSGHWLGALWLSFGVLIIAPALYVIPWFLSINATPMEDEQLRGPSVDCEIQSIIQRRAEVEKLPWWVHHAWRNYQFTRFWLILGLYAGFFVGSGLLGLSIFAVLSGQHTLREALPFMGNACLAGLGLMTLVLLVLLPIRVFARWQMQRWEVGYTPTEQETMLR